LALALAAAALCVGCANGADEAASAPELIEPVAVPADLVPVRRGDISLHTIAPAVVKPEVEALHFMKTDVPLLAIHVQPGQVVTAGEVLAELDTADHLEELDELRDELAHLELVWAHENDQARADIELIRLQPFSGTYTRELQRYQAEEAERALTLETELQAIERERMEALIAEGERRLGEFTITAPFDGVVMHVADIYPGAPLDPPRQDIIWLADMSAPRIECDSWNFRTVGGNIRYAASVGELEFDIVREELSSEEALEFFYAGLPVPRRFQPVDASVRLSPDQHIYIHAYGGEKEDVLWLPPNAVHTDSGFSHFVYTDMNGVRVRRGVEIGLITDIQYEVTEGLEEGEMVYVD
jgi:multidrug efflux pump subunit AcrA (membrane-fusion protein)